MLRTATATPPRRNNIGKRRSIIGINGDKRLFAIEDEIVRRERTSTGENPKLLYFQKLRFDDQRRRFYWFKYYMLGLKPRGRWVFGQYSLVIPTRRLRAAAQIASICL